MEIVNVIMAALFLLVILYIVAQVFMKPIKLLWKLLINSGIGLVLLMLVNYIATYFDFFIIPINIITVLIAGFLGIPGIFLLICFQLLLM
ncbi:MAG: pro-sigmaK processing inhibitor BofA family protein [Syntrophomonadaceae bacterium]|nr:pro-sigmaK processing inhibitor BofA family protein [Syntrophomonadaceae bacterium]MDD3889380.1 pro-sigmaK processing inhibitor BofA family protein [Syntrophomonadaceae bacterium]MDD4548445.1 pro-sigmaK processing inhibitor BofA family protein [Syntrophomonadaceae bacterium]